MGFVLFRQGNVSFLKRLSRQSREDKKGILYD